MRASPGNASRSSFDGSAFFNEDSENFFAGVGELSKFESFIERKSNRGGGVGGASRSGGRGNRGGAGANGRHGGNGDAFAAAVSPRSDDGMSFVSRQKHDNYANVVLEMKKKQSRAQKNMSPGGHQMQQQQQFQQQYHQQHPHGPQYQQQVFQQSHNYNQHQPQEWGVTNAFPDNNNTFSNSSNGQGFSGTTPRRSNGNQGFFSSPPNFNSNYHRQPNDQQYPQHNHPHQHQQHQPIRPERGRPIRKLYRDPPAATNDPTNHNDNSNSAGQTNRNVRSRSTIRRNADHARRLAEQYSNFDDGASDIGGSDVWGGSDGPSIGDTADDGPSVGSFAGSASMGSLEEDFAGDFAAFADFGRNDSGGSHFRSDSMGSNSFGEGSFGGGSSFPLQQSKQQQSGRTPPRNASGREVHNPSPGRLTRKLDSFVERKSSSSGISAHPNDDNASVTSFGTNGGSSVAARRRAKAAANSRGMFSPSVATPAKIGSNDGGGSSKSVAPAVPPPSNSSSSGARRNMRMRMRGSSGVAQSPASVSSAASGTPTFKKPHQKQGSFAQFSLQSSQQSNRPLFNAFGIESSEIDDEVNMALSELKLSHPDMDFNFSGNASASGGSVDSTSVTSSGPHSPPHGKGIVSVRQQLQQQNQQQQKQSKSSGRTSPITIATKSLTEVESTIDSSTPPQTTRPLLKSKSNEGEGGISPVISVEQYSESSSLTDTSDWHANQINASSGQGQVGQKQNMFKDAKWGSTFHKSKKIVRPGDSIPENAGVGIAGDESVTNDSNVEEEKSDKVASIPFKLKRVPPPNLSSSKPDESSHENNSTITSISPKFKRTTIPFKPSSVPPSDDDTSPEEETTHKEGLPSVQQRISRFKNNAEGETAPGTRNPLISSQPPSHSPPRIPTQLRPTQSLPKFTQHQPMLAASNPVARSPFRQQDRSNSDLASPACNAPALIAPTSSENPFAVKLRKTKTTVDDPGEVPNRSLSPVPAHRRSFSRDCAASTPTRSRSPLPNHRKSLSTIDSGSTKETPTNPFLSNVKLRKTGGISKMMEGSQSALNNSESCRKGEPEEESSINDIHEELSSAPEVILPKKKLTYREQQELLKAEKAKKAAETVEEPKKDVASLIRARIAANRQSLDSATTSNDSKADTEVTNFNSLRGNLKKTGTPKRESYVPPSQSSLKPSNMSKSDAIDDQTQSVNVGFLSRNKSDVGDRGNASVPSNSPHIPNAVLNSEPPSLTQRNNFVPATKFSQRPDKRNNSGNVSIDANSSAENTKNTLNSMLTSRTQSQNNGEPDSPPDPRAALMAMLNKRNPDTGNETQKDEIKNENGPSAGNETQNNDDDESDSGTAPDPRAALMAMIKKRAPQSEEPEDEDSTPKANLAAMLQKRVGAPISRKEFETDETNPKENLAAMLQKRSVPSDTGKDVKDESDSKANLAAMLQNRIKKQENPHTNDAKSSLSAMLANRAQPSDAKNDSDERGGSHSEKSSDGRPALKNDPKYEKYFKMLKIGMPLPVVQHAMTRDGLDPSIMECDHNKPAPQPKPEGGVPLKEDPEFAKYFKMLKLGLPMGAVKNAMERDGLDSSIMDGDHNAPASKSGSGSAKSEKRQKDTHRRTRLHWDTLGKVKSNTVWALVEEDQELEQIEIDEKEFTNLFQAEIKGASAAQEKSSSSSRNVVQVIDPKRANNGGIILARLRMSYDDMAKAVERIDETAMTANQAQGIIEYMPTFDERKALRDYMMSSNGDSASKFERLCECEKFMVAMMTVKQSKKKIRALLFKLQFRGCIHDLAHDVFSVEKACDELNNSVRLRKLFGIVLNIGNRLNTAGPGEKRKAGAFTIQSLLKLNQAKAFDNKTTFLHYVVLVVQRNSETLLDFKQDLPTVAKADKVFWDQCVNELEEVETQLENVRKLALHEAKSNKMIYNLPNKKTPQEDHDSDDLTVDSMSLEEEVALLRSTKIGMFALSAIKKVSQLRERVETAKNKFSQLLEYFGEDKESSKMQPHELFEIMSVFIRNFDAAKEDVIKMEKEKKRDDKKNQQIADDSCSQKVEGEKGVRNKDTNTNGVDRSNSMPLQKPNPKKSSAMLRSSSLQPNMGSVLADLKRATVSKLQSACNETDEALPRRVPQKDNSQPITQCYSAKTETEVQAEPCGDQTRDAQKFTERSSTEYIETRGPSGTSQSHLNTNPSSRQEIVANKFPLPSQSSDTTHCQDNMKEAALQAPPQSRTSSKDEMVEVDLRGEIASNDRQGNSLSKYSSIQKEAENRPQLSNAEAPIPPTTRNSNEPDANNARSNSIPESTMQKPNPSSRRERARSRRFNQSPTRVTSQDLNQEKPKEPVSAQTITRSPARNHSEAPPSTSAPNVSARAAARDRYARHKKMLQQRHAPN